MSVNTLHPDLTVAIQDQWELSRCSYEGESAIKEKREKWLVKPEGFGANRATGERRYRDYLSRAQFPEILGASVGAMIGIIHDKEIEIELPAGLEYLREDADGKKSTLDDYHRRLTRELLVMGRVGQLTDAPEAGGDPRLALYKAPTIINWDEDFFVLDESHMARDGFEWARVKQHRVLMMDGAAYMQKLYIDEKEAGDIYPAGQGGGTLNFIPFVIAGAKDLGADIETPPLMGISRAALAMYQLSADYRHQLYMSGQETLVAINGEAPDAVGAGVVHEMKGAQGITPDLKYVAPACTGIDRHKEAIELNRDAAVQAGARLFEQSNSTQESGEARKMRFRSEAANLQTVADASTACLERGLRYAAMMRGLAPETVNATPPEGLLDKSITAQEANALWQIARDGGISYQTFYENLAAGGIASPERDSDEEFDLIQGQDFADSDAV